MVKIIGILLILAAGYLFSQRMISPTVNHMKLLEEGEFLFRVLESEIRNTKTPLPELFAQISGRTESVWKDFFRDLSDTMTKCGDFEFIDEFDRLLTYHMAQIMPEEERMIFFNAGRNLLSDDFMFQRNTINQLSEQLRDCISKMNDSLKIQKKVYQALCLSVSALLIIILI